MDKRSDQSSIFRLTCQDRQLYVHQVHSGLDRQELYRCPMSLAISKYFDCNLLFNKTAYAISISVLGFTKICTPIAVSLLRTILTSLLTANSSRVFIGCFILGVVRAEVTIPVYEFTRTMAHKTQAPASIRNEKRLAASLPPFIKLIQESILILGGLN